MHTENKRTKRVVNQTLIRSKNLFTSENIVLLRSCEKKTEVIGFEESTTTIKEICTCVSNINSTGGFSLLGVPVGSEEFSSHFLIENILPPLQRDLERLELLPDPQIAFTLLRSFETSKKKRTVKKKIDDKEMEKMCASRNPTDDKISNGDDDKDFEDMSVVDIMDVVDSGHGDDVLAGITISFLHLSQGLAYGDLAGLTGANGLYTSFYIPVFYAIFGTSRHASLGTFAIISLMTKNAITKAISAITSEQSNAPLNILELKQQLSMTLTFLIGSIMAAMSILRIGTLVVFFTKALVGGYICAASFFVFTSQVPSALGIKVDSAYGFGVFIKNWVNILKSVRNTNIATMLITLCCITLIAFGRMINMKFIKRTKILLPYEVVCIAVACLVGKTTTLYSRYNVTILGDLPRGLIPPTVPNLSLSKYIYIDAFTIAFVIMTINFAVILQYAQKYHYSVSTDQDLLAYGITNMGGSFFKCLPSCSSLSRTAIACANFQKTQISAIVSSIILLVIMYTIIQFLGVIPLSILSGIVMYNIFGSMRRIKELKTYWSIDFMEGAVWLASFIFVLLMDLDIGLILSLGFSILLNTLYIIRPKFKLMGIFKSTYFLDTSIHPEAKEINNARIINMDAPLLSYNSNQFKQFVYQTLEIEKTHQSPGIAKLLNKCYPRNEDIKIDSIECDAIADQTSAPKIKHCIIDCSEMSRIDSEGIRVLNEIKTEILKCNGSRSLLFANMCDNVFASIDADGSFEKLLCGNLFHNVADAVAYLNIKNP
ncbi:hypothetical protein GJ496_004305 [Pomphorhynchus laevis]|nr:hypothetical protein GJ496_004305 [Pomphorhynchus laevis]